LCASTGPYKVLFEKDRYSLPVRTVECDDCKLTFSQPMPTEHFLNKFYSSGIYRGLDWGIVRVNEKVVKEFGAVQRARIHVDFIKHFLSQLSSPKKNIHSILDIGSSEGSFLTLFKQEFPGTSLYAVEPGKHFRYLHEKDFTKIYNNIDNIESDKKFDVITLWHVLEHVRDPIPFLQTIAKHLHSDGYLIFEVPSVSRYFGMSPIHIDHVIHLNKITAQKMLDLAGFDITFYSEDNSFLMDKLYGMKIVARLR